MMIGENRLMTHYNPEGEEISLRAKSAAADRGRGLVLHD